MLLVFPPVFSLFFQVGLESFSSNPAVRLYRYNAHTGEVSHIEEKESPRHVGGEGGGGVGVQRWYQLLLVVHLSSSPSQSSSVRACVAHTGTATHVD